jgi:hypothetical protein
VFKERSSRIDDIHEVRVDLSIMAKEIKGKGDLGIEGFRNLGIGNSDLFPLELPYFYSRFSILNPGSGFMRNELIGADQPARFPEPTPRTHIHEYVSRVLFWQIAPEIRFPEQILAMPKIFSFPKLWLLTG